MKDILKVTAAAIAAIVICFATMEVCVAIFIEVLEVMKSDCPTFIKVCVGVAFFLFLYIPIEFLSLSLDYQSEYPYKKNNISENEQEDRTE